MEGKEKGSINFTPRSIEDVTVKFGVFGRTNMLVFAASVIICIGFVIWGIIDIDSLGGIIGNMLSYTLTNWGWLYMLSVFACVVFLIALCFTKYGKIKFGKDDEVPEYSTFSWFSMLFGAGMGVGLIFWSVAEPLYHYLAGPTYGGVPGTPEAAENAMAISFMHWGISAWSTFALVGIAMGLMLYRKGLPALISSVFYPLLGDKIYGPIGKFIDIMTLCVTFFGVATTVGLGTMQLAAGISFNYGVPLNNSLYIPVLIVCCIGYMCSATLPIEKGIKRGSNISMVFTLLLMLFLFVVGPTQYILDNFVNATGIYIQNFVSMSLWTDPVDKTGWLGSWTIFYWAWWISWCPFVGLFIAKISKGRTIREFVLAALIAPSVFDMIFMNIFGTTAINFEMMDSTKGILYEAINADVASAIFVMFDLFPGSVIIAPILLFVSYTFFVVSADSATIVLGMLSTGGNESPKTSMKLLWGISMASAALILMLIGGLSALQTACIVSVLPFIAILIAMAYSIIKILTKDPDYVDRSAKPTEGDV